MIKFINQSQESLSDIIFVIEEIIKIITSHNVTSNLSYLKMKSMWKSTDDDKIPHVDIKDIFCSPSQPTVDNNAINDNHACNINDNDISNIDHFNNHNRNRNNSNHNDINNNNDNNHNNSDSFHDISDIDDTTVVNNNIEMKNYHKEMFIEFKLTCVDLFKNAIDDFCVWLDTCNGSYNLQIRRPLLPGVTDFSQETISKVLNESNGNIQST